MMDSIVIDSNCVPLHNSRLVYFIFNTVAVSTSKRYYFVPDKQLSGNTITGINCVIKAIQPTDFPTKVQVNGLDYNVLQAFDLSKILVNIVGKDNKYIMRRIPLAGLTKFWSRFETHVYDIDLQIDACYLEFVSTPLVTALPMVIPFNFMWSEKQK